MSKYTTELRYICESFLPTEPNPDKNVEEIITHAIPRIFNYPFIFVNSEITNKFKLDFVRHFYFREIGFETFSLFKFKLHEKISSNLEYYNSLYVAELNRNDIFEFTTETITHEQTETINRETTNENIDDENKQDISVFSDTPQGGLNGLLENKYMTTATKTTADNLKTTESTNLEETGHTNNYTDIKTGGNVPKISLIKNFYEILQNTEQIIFNDMNDLFMGVW